MNVKGLISDVWKSGESKSRPEQEGLDTVARETAKIADTVLAEYVQELTVQVRRLRERSMSRGFVTREMDAELPRPVAATLEVQQLPVWARWERVLIWIAIVGVGVLAVLR